MKIISGGQTGVDRAALDAAIELGFSHGGWVPKGRLAEDGRISLRYQMQECASADYPTRTEKNVMEADATLILCRGPMNGGTEFTHYLCLKHRKPVLALDLEQAGERAPEIAAEFIRRQNPAVLNVAGPRESSAPGIYLQAKETLKKLLLRLRKQ